MATVTPFHHGLRLRVEKDQAPPITIPATGVILLIGTAGIGPINTPVLLVGNQAEGIRQFGQWEPWHKASGITIPEALESIYSQGNATVAVINVRTDIADNKAQAQDDNYVFDRRGVLKLSKSQLTDDLIAVGTNASFTKRVPYTGSKIINLPKNYTTVTVTKIGGGAVTSSYVAGTGVLTITDAGVANGEEVNIAVTATWSSTTDYTIDRLLGTLTAISTGRMFAGMLISSVSYYYPDVYFTPSTGALNAMIIGTDNGGGVKTGLKLADSIESLLHVVPKILICPRLTDRPATDRHLASPVINAMNTAAKYLGGRVFATTEKQRSIVEFANDLTLYSDPESRVGVLAYPYINVTGPDGNITDQPPCARLAGIQATVDAAEGFHESFSNRKIEGALSVTTPIVHSWTQVGTESDYLNERGGVVIVSEQGYFKGHGVWQPNGEMLSVLRIADAINVAIVNNNHDILDRAFTKERPRQVIQKTKALFRQLETDGALIPNPNPTRNPDMWLDPALNTPELIAQGKVSYSYRMNPTPLMTDITFTAHITRDYLSDFVKNINVIS